jgi:hypothetical protein
MKTLGIVLLVLLLIACVFIHIVYAIRNAETVDEDDELFDDDDLFFKD